MIDFITGHLKIIIIISIILLILGYAPEITQLPFGMDSVFSTFVGTIHGVLETIEFLIVPWYLFIAYLTIESAFFLWKWINYFIDVYKSS